MKSTNTASVKVDYKKFYTSPWGIVFITYFVAMGLVGALTPADILTANSWARDFCNFMAGICSQIDAVTAIGLSPDINRFYFSVLWTGSPILLALSIAGGWFTRKSYLSNTSVFWRMPFAEGFGRFLAALILVLAGYFFFHFATDASSRVLRGILNTPLGRAVAAQFFVHGLPVILGGILIFMVGWLTGYIPRNIKKQNELEKFNN